LTDGTTTIDLRCGAAPADPSETDAPTLLELAGLLNRSPSGLAFVYEALETVGARYGATDAALVLEEKPIGRQVFRLRRSALARGVPSAWLRSALAAPPGLYTDPPGVVDGVASGYLTSLASTALRLDLLGHDASHDALTGLLNRRSYERALDEAVARTRRYGWPFALVLLDLDNFKAVNDEFGHAAGDAALRVIGAEVRAVLRRGDVAARLGGDEFALIVLNADSPAVLAPLTQRLRKALSHAVPDASIAFSAGVACFPDDADDLDRLERLADGRLYADKSTL
jgi:diguanylate cyclase (GGDEF)-like protein